MRGIYLLIITIIGCWLASKMGGPNDEARIFDIKNRFLYYFLLPWKKHGQYEMLWTLYGFFSQVEILAFIPLMIINWNNKDQMAYLLVAIVIITLVFCGGATLLDYAINFYESLFLKVVLICISLSIFGMGVCYILELLFGIEIF